MHLDALTCEHNVKHANTKW